MLQLLARLLKALNSEASPGQISCGFVLGMIMGFTPLMSAHNLLLLLIVCLFKVNVSAVLVALGVFSAIAYLLDPVFISIGADILNAPAMQAQWTAMYQIDFWRVMHFNHTLTMGSLLISLILALPLFLIFRFLIVKYRVHIMAWIEKSKLINALKASKLFGIYQRLSGNGGL